MNKLPFSNFDLPRQHLSEHGHYVPARAREPEEIARRQSRPSGTLVLEHQARGLHIAHSVLRKVTDGDDLRFTSNLLAMATLNSGWYSYAQAAPDVMRRRLLLPMIANPEKNLRLSQEELRDVTIRSLGSVAAMADVLVLEKSINVISPRAYKVFGQQIGGLSLKLAALSHGVDSITGNDFQVQKRVRGIALETLEGARGFDEIAGSHASMAQLADNTSDMTVYWDRHAPDDAYQTFLEARAA